jgi:hypothetical protein
MMRASLPVLALLLPTTALAQTFRCGEPNGIGMWSNENHKPSPDGFRGVEPIVIVSDKEMTVFWGDTKLNPAGVGRKWKAVIFLRSPQAVSAVALDADSSGTASMLYTLDVARGYLYMSTHKTSESLGLSHASTYVSKCSSK